MPLVTSFPQGHWSVTCTRIPIQYSQAQLLAISLQCQHHRHLHTIPHHQALSHDSVSHTGKTEFAFIVTGASRTYFGKTCTPGHNFISLSTQSHTFDHLSSSDPELSQQLAGSLHSCDAHSDRFLQEQYTHQPPSPSSQHTSKGSALVGVLQLHTLPRAQRKASPGNRNGERGTHQRGLHMHEIRC